MEEESREKFEEQQEEDRANREARDEERSKYWRDKEDRRKNGWRVDWPWRNFEPRPGDYYLFECMETDAGEVCIWKKTSPDLPGPPYYVTQGTLEGLLDANGHIVPLTDNTFVLREDSQIRMLDKGKTVLDLGGSLVRGSAKEFAKEVGWTAIEDVLDPAGWVEKQFPKKEIPDAVKAPIPKSK